MTTTSLLPTTLADAASRAERLVFFLGNKRRRRRPPPWTSTAPSGGAGALTAMTPRKRKKIALAAVLLGMYALTTDLFLAGEDRLKSTDGTYAVVARRPSSSSSGGWRSFFGRRRKKKRRLEHVAEEWCYNGNMLTNGDFSQMKAEWSHHGTAEFGVEIMDVNGTSSRAAVVQNKEDVYNGIKQNIDEAVPCVTGHDFFFHVQAKVKMYDKDTGEGVHTCMNGQTLVANEWVKNHCPFFRFHGWKNGTFHNFDAFDTLHDWDGDGWNTIDFVTDVIPGLQGDDVTSLVFSIRGGPPGSVMLIDDVIVRRMDVEDVPEGIPIYDPDAHYDCSTNMLQNGDAEYQSALSWDVHRFWHSESPSLGTVDLGGEHGHVFVAYNREVWRQGLGQDISPELCFRENDLYVRIQADFKVYDQDTGEGVTDCGWSTYPKNCPSLKVWYVDPGVSWQSHQYFDFRMNLDWKADDWNHLDLIVALSPGLTVPTWKFTRFAFMGGPPNSVLMLDNAVVTRLSYEDIPAGHDIWDITGKTKTTATKECYSRGDPHLLTFGGSTYDNHTAGWQTLYDGGGLVVETYQTLASNLWAAWNSKARVTYQGKVYFFEGLEGGASASPAEDEYYQYRDSGANHKFVIPDPAATIYIDETPSKPHLNIDDYHYDVYIFTKEVLCDDGVCCDIDPETLDTVPPPEEAPVEYPDWAPTQEEAEEACAVLREEDEGESSFAFTTFDECVFDFLAAATEYGSEEDGPNVTVATETVVDAAVEKEASLTQSVDLEQQAEAYAELTGGGDMFADAGPGAQGDPTIVGIRSQAFKFDGRSDAWYANLAAESLQWNMKFHKFDDKEEEGGGGGCPEGEDMFVTGVAIGLRDERHRLAHTVVVKVRDERSFFPGCEVLRDGLDDEDDCNGNHDDSASEYNDETCLGSGSLEIVLDGETISHPGDYITATGSSASPGIRVVAHNTYEACSRRWYDYVEPSPSARRSDRHEDYYDDYDYEDEFESSTSPRHLSRSKPPLDFLADAPSTALRPEACAEWIHERTLQDDLFRQPGSWSTIHIETPLAAFHIEYRQNASPNPRDKSGKTMCLSHSVDAWMTGTSSRLRAEKWRGILGETRYGDADETDRYTILMGKDDGDYEVTGPFGTNFPALGMSHWLWGPVRGAVFGS